MSKIKISSLIIFISTIGLLILGLYSIFIINSEENNITELQINLDKHQKKLTESIIDKQKSDNYYILYQYFKELNISQDNLNYRGIEIKNNLKFAILSIESINRSEFSEKELNLSYFNKYSYEQLKNIYISKLFKSKEIYNENIDIINFKKEKLENKEVIYNSILLIITILNIVGLYLLEFKMNKK